MSASVEMLENTRLALRDALVSRDWSRVGELDQRCRQVVEEVMVEPHQNEVLLRQHMEDLLSLYRELVAVCQVEQQRIANELRQLNQSQHGAKVYKLFG